MIDRNDPRLTAYLLGELDAVEHEQVQAALSESAELRAHVEALRGTIGMLQDAFGDVSGDSDQLTVDQLAAIDASVELAADEDAVTVASERTRNAGQATGQAGGRSSAVRWVLAALVLLCAGMAMVSTWSPVVPTALVPTALVPAVEISPPGEIVVADDETDLDEGIVEVADGAAAANDVRIEGTQVGGRVSDEPPTVENTVVDSSPARPGRIMFGGAVNSDVGGDESGDDPVGFQAHHVELPGLGKPRFAEQEVGSNGMGMEDMGGMMDMDLSMDDKPVIGMGMGMGMEEMMTEEMPMEDMMAMGMDDMAGMGMDDMAEMGGMMGMEDMMMGMGMSGAEEEPPIMYSEAADGSGLSRHRLAIGQRSLQNSRLLEVEPGDGADPPDVLVQTRLESKMLMETPRIRISKEEELPQTGFDPTATKAKRELDLAQAIEISERADEKLDLLRAKQRGYSGGWAMRFNRESLERLVAEGKLPPNGMEEEEPVKTGFGDQGSKRPPKTWKPASASTNRARLSVGHHDDLRLATRDTYVRIDGFRARVMFDLYYYNDRERQLEGQFLLRLPDDASLHYFAFGPANVAVDQPNPMASAGQRVQGKGGADEQDQAGDVQSTLVRALRQQTESVGSDLARRAMDPMYRSESGSVFANVKQAYVAPRQKAAKAYQETVRRRVDPALVEWAGPGIFQTKVFPLMPGKLHRIVVGYDVTLTDDGSDQLFNLSLPAGEAGGRVEFDIAAVPGTEAEVSPETLAFVSGERAYYRYESAEPRDYSVRLTGANQTVLRYQDKLSGGYFATRLHADLPDDLAKVESRDAVFLLDTSWSDRPVAFARHLELLREILTQNRDTIDRFAVMTFNVHQHWWRDEFTTNDDAGVDELAKFADQLVLEGATDLCGAIREAVDPAWARVSESASSEPKKSRAGESSGSLSPLPNYFLLSDAVATWGATDLSSIVTPLKNRFSAGGAMFVYDLVGLPSDRGVMRALADASSGAVFAVAAKSELAESAKAHRSQPWRLADVSAKGGDDVLVQGASSAIYPGQSLIVAGSGTLSGEISLTFERGRETKTILVDPAMTVASPAAARMYGQVAVELLENVGQSLQEISVAFARYFRVPGRTCSMVMLDSKADYERFGVKVSPEDDLLVIGSTTVEETVSQQMELLAGKMASPKSRFVDWVKMMQDRSVLNVSTALQLAMRQMPDSSFQMAPERLECKSFLKSHFQVSYLETLAVESPETEWLFAEAEQALIAFGVDDAIKTASTLMETKSSDAELLRSLAFRAIHWNRGDQAAHLMWRVVQSRGYQPQSLLLLARAFEDAGRVESALVCLDLVTSGTWNTRWASSKVIAGAEMLRLMEQVDLSESCLAGYVRARKRQLVKEHSEFDVAVVMHWNTDRTDVDLHVTEPGGETCYYKNKQTESGGRITSDVTQGLGPEMYILPVAPAGGYHVQAKYFRGDENRTGSPTELLVSVLQGLGRKNGTVQTKRISLGGADEMHSVLRWRIPEVSE